MPMQGRTKKILAMLVVVALITAGGLAAVVTTLVQNAPPTLPTITAYAHGKTVEVEAGVCDSNLRCADLQVADLPVPAGATLPSPTDSTLSLSLPKEIAESDWQLFYRVGDLRTGQVAEDVRTFTPGEAYAVTLPPADIVRNPEDMQYLQLLEVIVQQPSTRDFAPVWAIDTYSSLLAAQQ